jgi:hypothetical protein
MYFFRVKLLYVGHYLLIRGENIMKRPKYTASLAIKLDPRTRNIVEVLAATENISLGEAARTLLTAGITARGLALC